jgi:hypothetical protein
MLKPLDHSSAQSRQHLRPVQPDQAARVQAPAHAGDLSKERQRIAQRMMKALAAMTPEACEHILGLTEAFALKHPAGSRLHLVRAGVPSHPSSVAPAGAR